MYPAPACTIGVCRHQGRRFLVFWPYSLTLPSTDKTIRLQVLELHDLMTMPERVVPNGSASSDSAPITFAIDESSAGDGLPSEFARLRGQDRHENGRALQRRGKVS